MNDPIWITGVGALTPVGSDFAEFSTNLLAGRTGIREVTGFDVSNHPCRIAGQVEMPAAPAEIDAAAYDRAFPLEQCTLWCSVQALQDAGLWAGRRELRIGLVLGLGAEMMLRWDHDSRRGGNLACDASIAHPSLVDSSLETLGLSGPGMSVAAACASGNHALAQARSWLQMGWVDVCLAGAC